MSEAAFRAGQSIAVRFELRALLGSGSFGAVWSAVDHARSGASVAVKILFDRYRRQPKMLGRFVQEARILEKLHHPGIASPIAWSHEDEVVYLALELIDGQTLDARYRATSQAGLWIPTTELVWICDRLTEAVAYAHRHDVVHRDLKPKNVMMSRRGEAPFLKVLDFGIAKMLAGSEMDPTTAGRVLGSVLYIAPEQVLEGRVDHRGDVFAIATMLFELTTMTRAWAKDLGENVLPFHVPVPGGSINSHIAVLKRIARGARPSAVALRGDLSAGVDSVFKRGLAVSLDERYSSVDEFASEFRRALS